MKAQIRGLEAAACMLVHQLDWLLSGTVGTERFYPGEGVHIHVPYPLPKGFVSVTIRPIGWPEHSFIEARFVHTISGWVLCEDGTITYPTSTELFDGITFSPTKSSFGIRLCHPSQAGREWTDRNIDRLIRSLRFEQRQLRLT